MNPNLDHVEQPAAVRGVVTTFTVLGALGQAFALPAMVVGAFAGPHLLLPAVALFAVGGAVIVVSRGIARGSRPAHIAGAVLATAVAAASVWWAVAMAIQAEESWNIRLFLGLLALILGAPFAVAAVTLWKTDPRITRIAANGFSPTNDANPPE